MPIMKTSSGSKLLSAVYSLYLRLLLLSWFWYPLGCHAMPCKDFFTGLPKPCFPQPINAARKRNVSATNTCGTPKSSYCEIGPGKTCFVCDANSSLTMHPARFMVDRESPFAVSPTWWQSETWWDTNQLGISKMGQPLRVNITLSFGKSYHVSGKIRVKFYSERPQALVIERSKDDGQSWMPYQYFAKDCLATYGITASESVPVDDPFEVTCSEEYSGQFPTKNGIVEFQAYTRYAPENYLQPEVQSYVKATHVRLRLEYPGTDGLELINSDVTLNRYYYAISDIRVDGRCDCHGHAEFCDGVGMNQYCSCEHNTDGRDCEHCLPLYNNQPWKAANKTHANECQKCNCNEHATACIYDSNRETGACVGCIDNTTATHCDQCIDGLYRNINKALSDPDVCLACDCFPVGIIDNESCNKVATAEISLGQCNCKPNVFGRRCDECIRGYWGFRLPPGGLCQDCACNVLGTLNSNEDCDQQSGACLCKPFVEGEKCTECIDGYYSFPTTPAHSCLQCACDLGGAFQTCVKESGLCLCRNNIEGERCVAPKSGYFYPNFDYLLFEAERQEEGNVDNHLERQTTNYDLFSGQGFARLTAASDIHFKNIQVNVSWKYYVVLRYSAQRLLSGRNLTLSIAGIDTLIPLSELQVGSGLAWTAEEAITLDSEKSYDVVVGFQGADMDDTILLLDSLVLKPEIASTRVYKESDPKAVDTLLQCFHNASALVHNQYRSKQCPSLVFSHSAEMYDGALACSCNQKGTNQVNLCNPNGQCACYEGVGGRTCNYCLAGYYGFGDGSCKVCQCDSAGVKSEVCNLTSGICGCKSQVSGERCDQCKPGTFNLDARNPQGCQSCFGYGHGHECSMAARFTAVKIASNFTDSSLDGWRIVDNSSTVVSVSDDGLEIDGNLTLTAPLKFLGVQLRSYKQRILIKVISISLLNTSHDAMFIRLKGRGYETLLKPYSRTIQNNTEFTFNLDEQHLSYGSPLTVFQFQSMLSNLTSVEVIVRSHLVLTEVVLESAVYDPMSDVSAHVGFVENMNCSSNYTGLSCETCATGFTRVVPNSGPFSACVPCSCNDRASECEPESGVCMNCDIGSAGDHCDRCQFNVIGPHCNVCADGFYGLTEDDRDCKSCDCHLPGTQYGNTSGCNVTTGQCKCNQTLHTGGRRCNVCQENAWNRTDSSLNCEECPPCYGMVKVEVDEFRQNFSSLLAVLHRLRKRSVLSASEPFSERIKRITKDVEELIKTLQVLQSKDDEVILLGKKAFETMERFDQNLTIQSTAVNITRNATERRLAELNEVKMDLENTRDLITKNYYLLRKTITNQTDQILNSLQLLRNMSTALHETATQSKTKADHIGRSRESVNGDLETAVQLITQATTDAMTVVAVFSSLFAKVSKLQVNSSSIKEIGENALSFARQRYHNASVVFNSTSQLNVTDWLITSNISENILWMTQRAEDDKKTATDLINVVENLVVSSADIANEAQQGLTVFPTLQEQVKRIEIKADEYHLESHRHATDAMSAVTDAEELHRDAENTLTQLRDFPNSVQKAKEHSDLSKTNVAEISSFHRSKILFAINVSESVESSFNASSRFVELSSTIDEHAREELRVVSNIFDLSQKLKNNTTSHQGVMKKAPFVDYIKTMVDPVRHKCSSLKQETNEALLDSTSTGAAAGKLLAKVESVSGKLDEAMKDFRAMPSVGTKSLSGMRSDIARIRAAFRALKLSSSIEKLRQGKITQERWLAVHKPRVIKLRNDVNLLRDLMDSLKGVSCNE